MILHTRYQYEYLVIHTTYLILPYSVLQQPSNIFNEINNCTILPTSSTLLFTLSYRADCYDILTFFYLVLFFSFLSSVRRCPHLYHLRDIGLTKPTHSSPVLGLSAEQLNIPASYYISNCSMSHISQKNLLEITNAFGLLPYAAWAAARAVGIKR